MISQETFARGLFKIVRVGHEYSRLCIQKSNGKNTLSLEAIYPPCRKENVANCIIVVQRSHENATA